MQALVSILLFVLVALIGKVIESDGQRDHGEPCSLRSQIANVFRKDASPEGCISSKGLICFNHKCTCADPSDVYQIPETKSSSPTTSPISISSAKKVLGGLFGLNKNSSPSPPTSGDGGAPAPSGNAADTGGRCVGRAGSPCFRTNSTCVEHATCESSGIGSFTVCKCQGIYSADTTGSCSKTASALKAVFKYGTSGITG